MQEFDKMDDIINEDENKSVPDAQTQATSLNNSLENEGLLPDQPDVIVVKKNEKLVIEDNYYDLNNPKKDQKPKEEENDYPNIQNQQQVSPKKEEPKPLSPLESSLKEVSRSSGLNLKAYFIEDNRKEIEALKNNPNIRNFQFNGDLKSFYRDTYRHILESNMIARQLDPDNKKLPDITKLTEKFEAFMKNVGQELKDRDQIEEYVPFGGLTAHEIREIQKDALMNRPKTREEALQRNASKLGGKDYDARIDNAYIQAHQTIDDNFGPNYRVGDNPKLDEEKLTNTINTIKGAQAIHDNKKIWKTYKPDFSAPKFNKPIWKHPISNTFKLIGRGIGIVWDCAVKFPINNASRGLAYPFKKVGSIINRTYHAYKLEKDLLAKGFTKEQIQEKMNENNSKILDIEKDSKNIEKQFESNKKIINDYKETKEKEKQKTVEKANVKDVAVVNNENQEVNPNRIGIEVKECESQIYEGELVPKVNEEHTLIKKNELVN